MFDIKDIETIKGHSELSASAKIVFKAFLNNFYNSWGTEARETIIPISVKFKKDSVSGYLRFDYIRYGRKEWLHVTGAHTWY